MARSWKKPITQEQINELMTNDPDFLRIVKKEARLRIHNKNRVENESGKKAKRARLDKFKSILKLLPKNNTLVIAEKEFKIYQLVNDSTFEKIFTSFPHKSFDDLCLTKEQIDILKQEYWKYLSPHSHCSIFFLYKKVNNYFVGAYYFYHSGSLPINGEGVKLDNVNTFYAISTRRIIVPADVKLK